MRFKLIQIPDGKLIKASGIQYEVFKILDTVIDEEIPGFSWWAIIAGDDWMCAENKKLAQKHIRSLNYLYDNYTKEGVSDLLENARIDIQNYEIVLNAKK